MAVPKRIRERFESGLKRLRPILQQQRDRDVSEADTVTLVKDVLSLMLGYDKYTELTGEYMIRGTYCDLAVKLDDKVTHLIEVKAIGVTLKERHLKQALGYAANEGIEWLVLTNGVIWRLYNVIFAKPIDRRLVTEFDLIALDLKEDRATEVLFALSREGYRKGAHVVLRDRQKALSRHLLAALLAQNRKVLNSLRREVRRIVNIRVEAREVRQVLRQQVIKRDVLEDPAFEEALGRVRSAQMKAKAGGGAKPVSKTEDRGSRVTLSDLLSAQTLSAPLRLHRKYKGVLYEAVLRADGMIELDGVMYENPSKAGSALRSRLAGRQMNTNGWKFWRYTGSDGSVRTLSDARDDLRSTRDRRASAPGADPGEAG